MESDSSLSTSTSSSSSSSPPPKKTKKHIATDCESAVTTVAAIRQALEAQQSSVSFLLTHLRRLLLLLLPSSSSALCDAGFLQLLPPLLSHSSSKVAKKSAQVAGVLAISSYEVSCRLAKEKEILSALARLLYRSDVDVLPIAIHSILNVATSGSGCDALREVAGLEHQLMRIVSLLAEMLKNRLTKVSDTIGDHDLTFLVNISLDEASDLFDLALAAVNTLFHDVKSVDVLPTLQSLWRIVDGEFLWTQNRRNHLAKLIMRLAMQSSAQVDAYNPVDARRIFGEDFFQKHWELSPITTTAHGLLSGFLEKIAGSSSPTRMLELLVDGMVACPPAAADELDMSVLYGDMEQELGLLPVFNQDILLLQCKSGSEILYPVAGSSVTSRDCVDAYTSGNTVVIRGLQFRWPEIAAVAMALGVELGQVTVGANLYLTPPGAQGLGLHFDDHCVFVCQLRGHKRWDVYPPLELLPRLYSFTKISSDLVNKDCATRCDLQEGDVLYIPRGFLHEARTEAGNVKAAPKSNNISEWHGASLHLSFGVEVEPAFEWEGLLHIALRLWSYNNCNTDEMNCEPLLHVAIRNAGTNSHLFRKACISLRQKNPDHMMFRLMLQQVHESADYHAVVKNVQKKEGSAWLDWLRHLSVGHFGYETAFNEAASEGTFQNVLHRFCEGASLLESLEAQEVLLSKFRKSRQKLMNGLLALHCGCWM